MSRHIVVWSGGADSTLLLASLLEKYNNTEPVVALTINHFMLHFFKTQQEEAARARITRALALAGYTFEHVVLNVTVDDGNNVFDKSDARGLVQPIVWYSNIFPYLQNDDIIYLGYIRGDDMWHHKTEIDNIVYYVKQLMYLNVKFKYPLEWVSKAEVYKGLKRFMLDQFVWTCETPLENGHPCHTCNPCRHKYLAEYELQHTTVNNPEIEL